MGVADCRVSVGPVKRVHHFPAFALADRFTRPPYGYGLFVVKRRWPGAAAGSECWPVGFFHSNPASALTFSIQACETLPWSSRNHLKQAGSLSLIRCRWAVKSVV